ERAIERRHAALRVGVVGGVDLLLHREVADPLELRLVGRQLECRVRAAERFRHVEDVLELLVRHVRAELLPRVDAHARVVVHLAQLLERIHRDAGAPRLELRRPFLLVRLLLCLCGLLFRREIRAATATPTTASTTAATRTTAGCSAGTFPARCGNDAFSAIPRSPRRARWQLSGKCSPSAGSAPAPRTAATRSATTSPAGRSASTASTAAV